MGETWEDFLYPLPNVRLARSRASYCAKNIPVVKCHQTRLRPNWFVYEEAVVIKTSYCLSIGSPHHNVSLLGLLHPTVSIRSPTSYCLSIGSPTSYCLSTGSPTSYSLSIGSPTSYCLSIGSPHHTVSLLGLLHHTVSLLGLLHPTVSIGSPQSNSLSIGCPHPTISLFVNSISYSLSIGQFYILLSLYLLIPCIGHPTDTSAPPCCSSC